MTLKTKTDLIRVKLKFTVYFVVFFMGKACLEGCYWLFNRKDRTCTHSVYLMISKTSVEEVCGA